LNNFILNRVFLKNYLKLKTYRNGVLTKVFSKNSKLTTFDLFKASEYSLFKQLISSRLVISENESFFLIKSGVVYVNGVVCTNPFLVVQLYDCVSVVITPNYYLFAKHIFNKQLKLTYLLGYRL